MKKLLLTTCIIIGFLSGCSKKDSGSTGPILTGPMEVEPNDQTAQALGTLGSTDYALSGSAANASDVDRYSIVTTGTINLFVSVSFAGGADLDVGIANGDGFLLVHRDTGNNPEGCTLAGRTAGTYNIEITSRTTAATQYTLTIGAR